MPWATIQVIFPFKYCRLIVYNSSITVNNNCFCIVELLSINRLPLKWTENVSSIINDIKKGLRFCRNPLVKLLLAMNI